MSVYVTGYTEARIDGKWYCIDFFQYDMTGRQYHIPCLEGQSMVNAALDSECEMERIPVPTDVSDQVRAACTGSDGTLFGEGKSYNPWHLIRGSWFGSVDLSQPELCGFFSRQDIANYLSNPSETEIDEVDMLYAQEYHELPDEEKKAYQYFEYTPTCGYRAIMRRFKQAVLDRIEVWNDMISWHGDNKRISLSDVRVLVVID